MSTAAAAGAVEVKPSPAAAELLELARSTDLELAGAAAAPGQAPPPPAIPLEVELAGTFELMGVGAGQFLPSVGEVLDEARCKALGDALAPVVRKYPWLMKYLTGIASVELRALMVAGPIALAIVAAARHDIAAARAARAAPAAAGLGAELPVSPPAQASSSPPPGALKPLEPIAEASA